jgi:hypothetical protein
MLFLQNLFYKIPVGYNPMNQMTCLEKKSIGLPSHTNTVKIP